MVKGRVGEQQKGEEKKEVDLRQGEREGRGKGGSTDRGEAQPVVKGI